MHHHRLAVGARQLHKQLEVGVIGGHRPGVVEVAEVAVGLIGPGRGRRLQQLVVRKDWDVGVGARAVHIVRRIAAGWAVPALPWVGGVDSTSEVDVAITPRHAAARHPPQITGVVGQPKMQPVLRQGQRRRPEHLSPRQLLRRRRQRATNEDRDQARCARDGGKPLQLRLPRDSCRCPSPASRDGWRSQERRRTGAGLHSRRACSRRSLTPAGRRLPA